MQGWPQVPGIDYGGTFAPICRLLAIAAELHYKNLMTNVKMAFLNVDVEEEVFFKMPPGYERSNKVGIPLVIELFKKHIYGLHQSLKNWIRTMDQFLGDIGFRPLKSDPCV